MLALAILRRSVLRASEPISVASRLGITTRKKRRSDTAFDSNGQGIKPCTFPTDGDAIATTQNGRFARHISNEISILTKFRWKKANQKFL